MKHQKHEGFRLIVSAIIILFVGLFTAQAVKADSTSLSDGTYTVPYTILKDGSNDTSEANQFFSSSANVNVTGEKYAFQLTTNGSQYIRAMVVGGQYANLNGSQVTFTLTNPQVLEPVSFALSVPVIGSMNEVARFQFNWGAATKTASSTSSTSTGSTSGTTSTATTTDTSSTAPVSSTSSSSASNTSREPNMAPSKTTAKKTTTSSSKKTATWKYVVLKSNSNAKSMANQYYTHVATVKKVNKHYNVRLKVSYKKSLKLGPKAVKPISIGSTKVKASAIKYGSTKKTYNMTYSFNISKLSKLKKIISGKIHVTVPFIHMSETYGIRFKFSQAS